MSDERMLNPEAEAAIAKVRRLMVIASVTTFLAVAAVLGVIGYRVFHLQGSAPPALETVPALPAGAKVPSRSATAALYSRWRSMARSSFTSTSIH